MKLEKSLCPPFNLTCSEATSFVTIKEEKMATSDEKHNVRLSKALSWLLRHHLDLVSEITKQPIGNVSHLN